MTDIPFPGTDRPATRAAAAASTASRWPRWLRPQPVALNLALQGGGAHGAFTWGVLDELLADGRFEFEGLSGSSAGAINAVLLADGWARDGRDGARAALAAFWDAVGRQMSPLLMVHDDGESVALAPASRWLLDLAACFSPAQLNPLELNPLRDLLAAQIDFERLRLASPFKLFVGATQANSGRLRLFREHELRLEMLLASACLPRLHHPVDIDGEPYWDGGYAANPAIFPLVHECRARDLLLVLLSPLRFDATPHSRAEIESRIVELAFSAHFIREMQTFARAAALADGWAPPLGRLERRLRGLRFHMIDTREVALLQRTDTKLIAHGPFLERLRDQGRDCARAWLAAHAAQVGRRATLDLQQCFG